MRVLPVGEHALLVECADAEETAACHAELLRRRAVRELPPVAEIVPAARTVLLDGVADPPALARELAGWRLHGTVEGDRRTVEVPVVYDGPDLEVVAAHWGVAPEEVGQRHAGFDYRVAFCGFAPGFAYLSGLDPAWAVPRRETPRTSVPAGSVGVAGEYTGVYPRSSPGGWRLVGRTDAPLWDLDRDPPALLTPGVRVRFVPRGGAR
ncbi:5-oxoprolinase subunit PxpB [Streptomyces sp. NPDC005438]|uniref:5-oxoprolinase subunit PxpB n=1 Tax=Streptomyces sp. NPDC005438 TaxID=3156880 RepID=UPI0033B73E4B